MPHNPVQVIIDPERFHQKKENKPSPRDAKDFYAYKDDEFREHKRALIDRVDRASSALERQSLGYLRVRMRDDALAKTHRPYTVFNPSKTAVVGAEDLGEILFEVTVPSLQSVRAQMSNAEETTRTRFDEHNNRTVENPSAQKHEVGAIETLTLLGPEDRVRFSAAEAVNWLSDPGTGGSYRVELFRMPPQRSNWDELPQYLLQRYKAFVEKLLEFTGLECERLHMTNKFSRWLRIRLSNSGRPGYHPFATVGADRGQYEVSTDFDADVRRHAKLLEFLQSEPLVRRVYPAPRLEHSRKRARPKQRGATIPSRASSGVYPIVAVVDGGIGQALRDWVVDRREILAPSHREFNHGTFIGGLLVAAGLFNQPGSVLWEADGCDLIDVAICPDETDPLALASYGGVDGFLDELEQAALQLRTKHGVRVFNVSSNTVYAAQLSDYSYEAQRLDEIADAVDVIIVQSGGNLKSDPRPEWDHDDQITQRALMACRDPSILSPAESIRNISVSALNQHGIPNVVADAPAAYSRRGPGLRAGVKPDFTHYGGASSKGLLSVDPSGRTAQDAGTSYSAPLVAKTLAAVAAKIEGEVSRETLIALLVHNSIIPEPLALPVFRHLARDFVGFGLPQSSEDILRDPDSSITLVFAGRLGPQMEFIFDFTWPQALTADTGACRGYVKMTMVSTPPLDHDWKSEIARVNIDTRLQQQKITTGRWRGHKNQYMHDVLPGGEGLLEKNRILEGLKWSPVKLYEASFRRGVGNSSAWRIKVDALGRAEGEIPVDGVPFSVLLTISDIAGEEDVFNQVRASLQQAGVRLADIQTASRIATRV